MILSFSTQLNGKPTYFIEKILEGLYENKLINDKLATELWNPLPFERKGIYYQIPLDRSIICKPKLHTIREDKNDRWGVGAIINFFINNRRPDMFRFAPDVPVVSVQRISITHYLDWTSIKIDGREISEKLAQELAINDGFETLADFLTYFEKDFTGKIIHWTDLQY